jgi:hypothetical protein
MTRPFACLVTASTFRRKTLFPVRRSGRLHATAPPRRRGSSAPTARYDLSQKRRCVWLLHRHSKTQPYRLLHVTAVLGRSGPGKSLANRRPQPHHALARRSPSAPPRCLRTRVRRLACRRRRSTPCECPDGRWTSWRGQHHRVVDGATRPEPIRPGHGRIRTAVYAAAGHRRAPLPPGPVSPRPGHWLVAAGGAVDGVLRRPGHRQRDRPGRRP